MNECSSPVFYRIQLETTIVILNLFVGRGGSLDSLKNEIKQFDFIFPQKIVRMHI